DDEELAVAGHREALVVSRRRDGVREDWDPAALVLADLDAVLNGHEGEIAAHLDREGAVSGTGLAARLVEDLQAACRLVAPAGGDRGAAGASAVVIAVPAVVPPA